MCILLALLFVEIRNKGLGVCFNPGETAVFLGGGKWQMTGGTQNVKSLF
jgi:hypothetical protein